MNPDSFVLGLFALILSTEKSKGIQHERKAVAAFQADFYDVPKWFVSIENASPFQDSKGIDVLIQTDDIAHPIYIQIKSCQKKADDFKRIQERGGKYRKDIAVVVIREHYTPQQVRQTILDAVKSERRRIFQEMSEKYNFKFIPA